MKLKYPLAIAAALSLTAVAFVSCMRGGTIDTIVVSPATATIARGTTQSFTASAHFSDGPSYTWTKAVEWSLSDTTDASIDTSGKVTTDKNIVNAGGLITTVTVYAKDAANNVVGTATLNIVDPFAINVTQVSPTVPYLVSTSTKQFTASAVLNSAGTPTVTQDITSIVNWATDLTSSDTATIDANGLLTAGTLTGIATIKATGKYSTAAVGTATTTIAPVDITSIAFDTTIPAIISLSSGSTFQFSAKGVWAPEGTTILETPFLTSAWTWSSSNTAVATIDANGLATAVASGTTGTVAIIATHPTISTLTSTETLTIN